MVINPAADTWGSPLSHSSVLVALATATFLVIVLMRAQRVHRRSLLPVVRKQKVSAAEALGRRRQKKRSAMSAAAQDTDGDKKHRSQSGSAEKAASATGGIRIYWGRTVLAILGVLALLSTVIGAALAVFTAVPWAFAGISAAALVAVVFVLQVSAIVRRRRKRHARVTAAITSAMNPEAAGSSSSNTDSSRNIASAPSSEARASHTQGGASTTEAAVFDAMNANQHRHSGPDSLVSTDEDGLSEDGQRLFGATPQFQKDAESIEKAHETVTRPGVIGAAATDADDWDIRGVPQAHYMVAAQARRINPEPEQSSTSEYRSSSDVKLKHSVKATEPSVSNTDNAVAAFDVHDAESGSAQTEAAQGHHPSTTEHGMDVHEVLRRRRA